MKTTFFLITLFAGAMYSYAQSDCKVYPSEISEFYTGDCKKGRAHGHGRAEGINIYEGDFKKGYPEGEGVYTWKNGDIYRGAFHKGLKHGKGELSFKLNGMDTTTIGYWREDKYIGLTNEPPYKILESTSIDRVSTTHNDSNINEIVIYFLQNGARNDGISDIVVQHSSGVYKTDRRAVVRFVDINMPFEAKVNYTATNKLKTSSTYCTFSFKISQEGHWEFRLNN